MGLKQGTPEEGGRSRGVHFRYATCAPGVTWHAHIAGAPGWFWCHTSNRTKPCLHWLTDGALPCPRCKPAKPAALIGYVPLWRESDGAPVFVIVHEFAGEHLAGLEHPARVLVMREETTADSIVVCRALVSKPLSSSLVCKRTPQDITPSLVKLWDISELTEWVIANNVVSDNAVSLKAKVSAAEVETQPAARPLDTNRLAAHFDARVEKTAEQLERERANAEWARTHSNGNGKPKR